MKIGVTIFGEPSGYPTNAIIAEYKNFIEANSNLTLDLTVSRHEALSQSELYSGDGGLTWYIDVAFLTTIHRTYIPTDVQVNILLYNWLNLTPSHGGLTWGGYGDPTGNNIPISTFHMGAPGQSSPDGPWTYQLANAMTHEFLHALGGAPGDPGDSSILSILGFSNFIDIDSCCFYGFNGFNWTPAGCPPPNDPGWQNCMRFFLGQITPSMYTALENLGTMTFRTNPGGCDVWKHNTYIPSVKLGTTDSSGNLSTSNLISGTIDYVVKKTGYYDSPEQRTIVVGGQYRSTPIVTLCTTPTATVTIL